MTNAALQVGSSRSTHLFAAAAFFCAFATFAVQPLIAKALMPVAGGSTLVWAVTTSIFQILLFAGYAFAMAAASGHLAGRRTVTLSVLLVAGSLLSVGAVGIGWPEAAHHLLPAGMTPALKLSLMILIPFGLAYVALASAGPLNGAAAARARAVDPYRISMASNAGSLLGLAAVPFALEPLFERSMQFAIVGGAGFLGLALTILGDTLSPRDAASKDHAPPGPIAPGSVVTWIAISGASGAFLTAATTQISTDIVAMPMVWVIPLGLWLLTYIAAFSRIRPWPDDVAPSIAALAAALMLIVGKIVTLSLFASLPIYAFGVFAVAYALHRRLHQIKPDGANLTRFFLAIAAGGAIGSSLATFVPPLVDRQPFELAVALTAGMLLMRPWRPPGAGETTAMAAIALAALAAAFAGERLNALPGGFWILFLLLLPLFAFLAHRRSGLVAAALVGLTGAVMTERSVTGETRLVERSFYGVHMVKDDASAGLRYLLHGSTFHGSTRLRDVDADRPVPTLYYYPGSPMGQAIRTASGRAAARADQALVTVVGLGTGALACHAAADRREREAWTFIEIDPAVIRIARDSKLFSYLARCTPGAALIEGDGRLELRKLQAAQDVIVLDAFSSDSVPTHLMTAEAMKEAVARLKPEGVLVIHVSNRHLDIFGTALATAARAGFAARGQRHVVDRADRAAADSHAADSAVVIVARSPATIDAFPGFDTGPDPAIAAWTDQRSELITPLLRRFRERTDRPGAEAKP
jgi:SAM-dependent methyltransferase